MRRSSKKYKSSGPRTHRVAILLNDQESRALERYCHRYHVQNRSKLIRETLMTKILNRFSDDSPTLFPDL